MGQLTAGSLEMFGHCRVHRCMFADGKSDTEILESRVAVLGAAHPPGFGDECDSFRVDVNRCGDRHDERDVTLIAMAWVACHGR